MDVEKMLTDLEQRFWTGDSSFYRQTLTQDATMVLPDPTGIVTRDAIIASIQHAPRWNEAGFNDIHVVRPTDDTAVLAYRAVAKREGDPSRYVALASSVYRRQAGEWKLAFHQQTPIQTS